MSDLAAWHVVCALAADREGTAVAHVVLFATLGRYDAAATDLVIERSLALLEALG